MVNICIYDHSFAGEAELWPYTFLNTIQGPENSRGL